MKRILVPLDGSRLAEAVLPLAEALARDHEADVHVLRTVTTEGPPDAQAKDRQDAETYLAVVCGALSARGLKGVRSSVWFGEPDQTIVNAALRDDASLITMSTHGRRGWSRVLFGSVAERLVRMAPVPVLLVRGQLPAQAGGPGRILVALDGSDLSEAVLPAVARLAGPLDLTIQLLHAIEPFQPTALPEVGVHLREMLRRRQADAERYLATVAQTLEAKGLRVRQAVRLGRPARVILQQAQDENVSLIAMSTHGRTGLGRLLMGSVAESVLRTAPVPTLLWKVPEWPPVEPPGVRGRPQRRESVACPPTA
jgi:nucleotide-binding universal stress UspA family protein